MVVGIGWDGGDLVEMMEVVECGACPDESEWVGAMLVFEPVMTLTSLLVTSSLLPTPNF